MCLMIILTNCVSDAEGLTAYRFGSTRDMIITINNEKYNIYLLVIIPNKCYSVLYIKKENPTHQVLQV